MPESDSINVSWTKRIDPISMLRDPLGIWTDHLAIQEEFTPGITSVTTRARYYTILAYYYEFLFKDETNQIVDPKKFEKIFILASLAHHDGVSNATVLTHMYNNQKFAGTWKDKQIFDLNFDINGFGRTYYNRQMEVFRCAWTDDFGKTRKSIINSKLANSISFINPELFQKQEFSEIELKENFDGFCICQISENEKERDILSKIFFGFFSEQEDNWDIDETQFQLFSEGQVELSFVERPPERRASEEYHSIQQQNIRRRNTLLLYLDIIRKTHPNMDNYRRDIWNSIYFHQHSETKENFDFGVLEHVRYYWELHQLNVFFVYLLERFLEEIQKYVIQNVVISKDNLINQYNQEHLFSSLSDRLGVQVTKETSLLSIIDRISLINGKDSKSSLNSPINETEVYGYLLKGADTSFLAEWILMLGLLYLRYHQNPQYVKDSVDSEQDPLQLVNLHNLFNYIDRRGKDLEIIPFITQFIRIIINRHLFTCISV